MICDPISILVSNTRLARFISWISWVSACYFFFFVGKAIIIVISITGITFTIFIKVPLAFVNFSWAIIFIIRYAITVSISDT
jgi:hypothetical protein